MRIHIQRGGGTIFNGNGHAHTRVQNQRWKLNISIFNRQVHTLYCTFNRISDEISEQPSYINTNPWLQFQFSHFVIPFIYQDKHLTLIESFSNYDIRQPSVKIALNNTWKGHKRNSSESVKYSSNRSTEPCYFSHFNFKLQIPFHPSVVRLLLSVWILAECFWK